MSARRKLFYGFVFAEKTFARDLRTARSGRAQERRFTYLTYILNCEGFPCGRFFRGV